MQVKVIDDVVDSTGVEVRGPTYNTMYVVSLAQKKFCQVGPVLTSYACDEGSFHTFKNTMKVDIVTRASRGIDWLDRCYDSMQAIELDWTWRIVATPGMFQEATARAYKRTEVYAAPAHDSTHDALCAVNFYLDTVPDNGQWFFNLDDDNLMHPNFNKLATWGDGKELVLFSQHVHPQWSRILDRNNLGPGHIDMAQFSARRSAIGDLRFWNIYRGDSYFIQELVYRMSLKSKESISYCFQVLSYYNAQRHPFTERP
jgi:hypothetical protein